MNHTTPLFAEIVFRGWASPAFAAALGGVGAAIAAGFTLSASAGVPVRLRATLAALRAAAVLSVAALALHPVAVTTIQDDLARPVVILVDDSESMAATDIPPSRLGAVKAALSDTRLRLLDRLADAGPVRAMTFGARPAAVGPRDPGWVSHLAGAKPRTALADSVAELLDRDADDLPAAVVVMTDGRDNASRAGFAAVAERCARLRVPLHVVGVGRSSAAAVRILGVEAAATVFVEDTVAVPVRYTTGDAGGTAEIAVRVRRPGEPGGREVARVTVPARSGGEYRETLAFDPEPFDVGGRELVVSLRCVATGRTFEDEVTKPVRVIDRKLRVLSVDSAPRWDFTFLQRALLRDRQADARFHLFDADPRAMRAGNPYLPAFPTTRAELFAYDAIVFGDVPASALTAEQQRFVREFVVEGGGLIHAAGRQSGSFAGTALAEVLPVELDPRPSPPKYSPFRPAPTTAGSRSPVLATDGSQPSWQTLPEMFWHLPVRRLKPAAEAWLVHPTDRDADNQPMPLLAAHDYGKGTVIVVGFDETWRWRLNEADRFFGRFWSQVVYAAGVPRAAGTKLTQLTVDPPAPLVGTTADVFAKLYDADLTPLTAGSVTARLKRAGDHPGVDEVSTVRLRPLPGRPGEYAAALPCDRAGEFSLTVEAGSGPATLEFRVSLPPGHERTQGGVAEAELRALAEASGGRYYRTDGLDELPDAVKPQFVTSTRKAERSLWGGWAMAWVFGLLVAEWALRKRLGLN